MESTGMYAPKLEGQEKIGKLVKTGATNTGNTLTTASGALQVQLAARTKKASCILRVILQRIGTRVPKQPLNIYPMKTKKRVTIGVQKTSRDARSAPR